MMAKQHIQFAAITAASAYVSFNQLNLPIFEYPVVFMTSTIIGALMPDIDNINSKISQLFPILASKMSSLGHRLYTHDVLVCGVIMMLCSLIFPYTIGFWFGYFSHLFIDSYTKDGIVWGYFFHKKWFKLFEYKRNIMSFHDGVIHLLPRKLRFYADSLTAKNVTIVLAFVIAYLFYQVGSYFDLNMDLTTFKL